MASKLLKALNNVETGRQNCINTLRNKKYELDDAASFDELSVAMSSVAEYDGTNVDYPELWDPTLTPETDPNVWHRPTDWPDLVALATNTEKIEDYILVGVLLLNNDAETTTFRTYKSGDQYASSAVNYTNLIIFGPTDSNTNRANTAKIITSDGSEYTLDYTYKSGAKPIEHTWDTTKDVDNKFRYVMLYVHEKVGNTAYYSMCSYNYAMFFNAGVLEKLSCFTYYNGTCSYDRDPCYESFIGINSQDPIGAAYERSTNHTLYLGVVDVGANTAAERALMNFHSVDDRYTNSTRSFSTSSYNEYLYGLSTIRTLTSTIDLSQFISAVYIKAKYINGLGNSVQASMGTSGTPYSYRIRKARYIEVLDNDAQLSFLENNTLVPGLIPYLKNINDFTKHIKTMSTSTSSDYYDCYLTNVNNKYLDLRNVSDVSGRFIASGSRAEVINLSSLASIPTSTTIGAFSPMVKYYMLPNLRVISGYLTIGPSLIKLDLPALTECSNTCFKVDASFPGPGNCNYNLLEINLPSLTTAPTSLNNILYYAGLLRKINLGEGFSSNLNLKANTQLSIDSIVNLFNKLADLTVSGASRTITLHRSVGDRLTEEEKAIATNKGWTISIVS